jgi:hypothetical protein
MSDSMRISIPASVPERRKDLAEGPSLTLVNLRLTATQLQSIRQTVLDELDKTGSQNPHLSRIDIVIALLICSLTQADINSPPVDHISMTLNVSV